jgi:hypothetical protein
LAQVVSGPNRYQTARSDVAPTWEEAVVMSQLGEKRIFSDLKQNRNACVTKTAMQDVMKVYESIKQ